MTQCLAHNYVEPKCQTYRKCTREIRLSFLLCFLILKESNVYKVNSGNKITKYFDHRAKIFFPAHIPAAEFYLENSRNNYCELSICLLSCQDFIMNMKQDLYLICFFIYCYLI